MLNAYEVSYYDSEEGLVVAFKKMASQSMRFVDKLKEEKDPTKKQELIHAIGAGIKFFASVQREQYGRVIQLEEK